jgi:hypothetical protein
MTRFIKSINFKGFRNNLHFEFFTGILALLNALGAGISYIIGLVKQLAGALADEDIAIDQVRRYDTTGEIHEYDHLRDSIFYGMRETIRTAFRHFDPDKSEAAHRLDRIFEDYKKAPKLSLPEESAAIHNLLQQLEIRRADIDLLGLGEWLEKLHEANDNVRSLMEQRDSDAAFRAQYRVKEVRNNVNRIFKEIIDKLEAAATLEGPDAYAKLFGEINVRIDDYNTLLAKEKGRRDKKKNPESGEIS